MTTLAIFIESSSPQCGLPTNSILHSLSIFAKVIFGARSPPEITHDGSIRLDLLKESVRTSRVTHVIVVQEALPDIDIMAENMRDPNF